MTRIPADAKEMQLFENLKNTEMQIEHELSCVG